MTLTTDDKIALTNDGYFPLTFGDVREGDLLVHDTIVDGTTHYRVVKTNGPTNWIGDASSHVCSYNVEVLDADGNVMHLDNITQNDVNRVWVGAPNVERYGEIARIFDPNYDPEPEDFLLFLIFEVDGVTVPLVRD